MGPAIFIIAASYSGCDRDLAVGMFTIAMSFMGTFYCGMKVNALDLAPNFAGTLMAIVNGIGAITGIIVPYLVGALTEDVIIDTLSLSPH
jgi:ACS family sodium-dependent inorganic phosphate cotransporter